jgi:hypothetical protein
VLERRRDQPAGFYLGDAAGAGAGVGGVVLQQVQGGLPGLFVGLADGVPDVRAVVDGPQQGGGLDGRENQVESRDGGALAAGFFRLDLADLRLVRSRI